MRTPSVYLLVFASILPGQIVTRSLAARYAMTDATGSILPDSSGSGNNGTLVNGPAIGSQGVTFSRASSQYAALPAGLSTTVKTIQIFMDCDRYLNAGTRAAVLGNSVSSGLKIWCGSYNGTSSPGLDKYMDIDMGTTLIGNINATTTTITLGSFERIGANFYFSIDNENILCATVTGNVGTNCVRGGAGSTPAAHTNATPVFGTALNNPSTSDFLSTFNLTSPSMFTLVLDPVSSRMLDNTTETIYSGFYQSSNIPFTIANNAGSWQLGGNSGEYFNGTIYYVLMYSAELTTAEIQQNVSAVQSIVKGRGVPARTDGSHTGNIVVCEGTSIDLYGGANGWCNGMALSGSPQVLVTALGSQTYGDGTTGILSYTVARDGPLTNPLAARNIMILGAPTNDFRAFSTIGQIEGYYSSTITAAKSEGYNEIYCGYMLSRTGTATGTGGTWDAAHDLWNTWLQSHYTSAGCTNVIPWDSRFTADGAWNNPNPTACGGSACFTSDGVHPSNAGFAAMSLLGAPIINGNGVAPASAFLTAGKTHTGNFSPGQTSAVYTLTVSNGSSAGPTSGTVTLSDTLPAGLTLVSMSGAGWSCSGTICTRGDVLNPGASYPAVTVTVNVAANATSPQVNQATVTGGGSGPSAASDSTVIASSQTGPPKISSVAGAGASVPPVTNVSPNGWVSLYGTNFSAPGTTTTGSLTQGMLPTTLAGICVTFGGIAAPLSLVSPTQINALVPGVPTGQSVQIQIVQNCGTAKPQPGPSASALVQAAAPEFLYWSPDASGHSAVVAVNAVTGVYVGPPGLLSGVTLTPAKPGDYLTIYAIGFGATNPPYLIGVAPPLAAPAVLSPSVSLGTLLTANEILYAGISPNSPGLYQLNIQVPPDIGDGDFAITLRLGAFTTPPGPYLSVRH